MSMWLKVTQKGSTIRFNGSYDTAKTNLLPFSEKEAQFFAAARESKSVSAKLFAFYIIANRIEQMAKGRDHVVFMDQQPEPEKSPIALAVEHSYSSRSQATNESPGEAPQ